MRARPELPLQCRAQHASRHYPTQGIDPGIVGVHSQSSEFAGTAHFDAANRPGWSGALPSAR